MGLKTKEPEPGATAPQQSTKPPAPANGALPPKPGAPATTDAWTPRVNAKVEERLNPYIEANQEDHDRYLRLAKENPERAARSMCLKDLEYLEREVTLKKNQIAGAKAWLAKQPAELQAFIHDQQAKITHPQQKELAMLRHVLNRMNFDNSRALASQVAPAPAPKAAPAMRVA
jgi:hypothetical protein